MLLYTLVIILKGNQWFFQFLKKSYYKPKLQYHEFVFVLKLDKKKMIFPLRANMVDRNLINTEIYVIQQMIYEASWTWLKFCINYGFKLMVLQRTFINKHNCAIFFYISVFVAHYCHTFAFDQIILLICINFL